MAGLLGDSVKNSNKEIRKGGLLGSTPPKEIKQPTKKPSQNVGASPVKKSIPLKPKATPEAIVDSMRGKQGSNIKSYIDSIPNLKPDYKKKLYNYGGVKEDTNIIKMDKLELNANARDLIKNAQLVPKTNAKDLIANAQLKPKTPIPKRQSVWNTDIGKKTENAMLASSMPNSAVNQVIVDKVKGKGKKITESAWEGFEKPSVKREFTSVTEALPQGYQDYKAKHPIKTLPLEIVANALTDPMSLLPFGAGAKVAKTGAKVSKAGKEVTSILKAVEAGVPFSKGELARQGVGVSPSTGSYKLKPIGYTQEFKPVETTVNKVSTVRDKTPDTYYHGTNANFDDFDSSKIGSYTGNEGFYGKGIYVSRNPVAAHVYGKNIMSTNIELNNPYKINNKTSYEEVANLAETEVIKTSDYAKDFADMISKNPSKFTENLKKLGYDGVDVSNGAEIVVFDASKVKKIGTKSNLKLDEVLKLPDSTYKQRQFTPSTTVQKGLQPYNKPIYPELKPKLKPTAIPEVAPTSPTLLENNNAMPPSVPSKGTKASKFSQTVTGSQVTTPELNAAIKKDLAQYTPVTNKETLDIAVKKVDTDYKASLSEFYNKQQLKTADDTALGEALITRSIKNGDVNEANRLTADLAMKLSESGQVIQAAAMMKRMTPEGMLMFAQRQVNKINEMLPKNKQVKLTEQEAQEIIDRMNRVINMPEGRAKDVEVAKVGKLIAEKRPTTIVDKTRAVRNMALLGNPKTFVRNIGGNTFMAGVDTFLSNTIGVPIDKALGAFTKQRSVGLPSLSKLVEGSKKGFGETMSDSVGGLSLKDLQGKSLKDKGKMLLDGLANPIDTQNFALSGNKFETGRTLAFKNKPMRILENVVNTSLRVGDQPFSQAYYEDVLNQLRKTNKVDVATEEMKQIAQQVAKERTYQDVNTISTLLEGIKKLPQKIQNHPRLKNTLQVMADSILPYVRTPGAILKRGLEYTPVGVMEGILKLGASAKDGKLTMAMQREIVDRISRGIVGSGILAGGIIAGKKGVATGAPNKDKDVATFERNAGKQSYAIKTGDNYTNYNWAQPMSLPFGAGVQAALSRKEGSDNLTAGVEGLSAAANFYADQPMLQSLQRLLNDNYGNTSIGERILGASLELPKQFIPAVVNQSRQMKDGTQRDTYSPNFIQKNLVKPIQNKIPGASQKLQPKLDTFGNEIKLFQGKNNFFNAAVNPATSTKYSLNTEQKEILRLYDATGEKTHFPVVTDKNIEWKGQKINFTPEEYTNFQKLVGQATQTGYSTTMKSDEYKNSTDADKIKSLGKIISDAKENAKFEILKGRNLARNKGVFDIPTSLTKNKKTIQLTQSQQEQMYDKIQEYSKTRFQWLSEEKRKQKIKDLVYEEFKRKNIVK